MTPLESQLLQHLGVRYLLRLTEFSFYVFLYGASFSFTRGMWLIHKFRVRSVCRALLCVDRFLCVRFFSPRSRSFLNKT